MKSKGAHPMRMPGKLVLLGGAFAAFFDPSGAGCRPGGSLAQKESCGQCEPGIKSEYLAEQKHRRSFGLACPWRHGQRTGYTTIFPSMITRNNHCIPREGLIMFNCTILS